MNERIAELRDAFLQSVDQATELLSQWISRFRNEDDLPQLLFALLLGVAIGWFFRSLVATKRVDSVSAGKKAIRTSNGKSKEEVELNARRRL